MKKSKLFLLTALLIIGLANVVIAEDQTIDGNLTVTNQIKGGFGTRTTSGTLDWDDISNITSGNGYTLLR